jgi:hypothetical protein
VPITNSTPSASIAKKCRTVPPLPLAVSINLKASVEKSKRRKQLKLSIEQYPAEEHFGSCCVSPLEAVNAIPMKVNAPGSSRTPIRSEVDAWLF